MSYLDKLHHITTFIFDVDGVFTDSSLYVLENGTLLRKMNSKDGFALRYAIEQGYRTIIITGGQSKGTVERFKALGVQEIYHSQRNKIDALEELVQVYGLNLGQVLYMGDDLPDYECMRLVHLPTCPADAVPEIMELAQYVSPYAGGQGCVRDVIEKVLRVQGKWNYIQDNTTDF
jgi:3-deoxy-D-manno-octulosonate 8-phosphate phosphatase (KDO 8-P phosphatase)